MAILPPSQTPHKTVGPQPQFYWRVTQREQSDTPEFDVLELLMLYKGDWFAGGVALWGEYSRWRSGRVDYQELQQRKDAARTLLLKSAERTRAQKDGVAPGTLIVNFMNVPGLNLYDWSAAELVPLMWRKADPNWSEEQHLSAAGWKP